MGVEEDIKKRAQRIKELLLSSSLKEALEQILKERGIPFSEENYIEGHLSRQNTPEAAALLDANPDVEAIFCVNDECALSL